MTSAQVQQIIDTLNHAAGAGWTVIVRQQYIVGWQETIIAAIFVLLGIVSVPLAFKGFRRCIEAYKDDNSYGATYGWWLLMGIPASMLVLNGLLVGLFLGSDALGHLLNPAAYAIYSVIP